MVASPRVGTLILAFLLLTLSGCFGGEDDPEGDGTGPDESPGPTDNGTASGSTQASLTFSATPQSGAAPLNVSFHANVTLGGSDTGNGTGGNITGNGTSGNGTGNGTGGNITGNGTSGNGTDSGTDPGGSPYTGNLTWTLSYGVGTNNSSGDQDNFLVANFTYDEGNHTADLTVLLEDGQSLTASVDISVMDGNGTGNGTSGPEPYHEEFEEAALFGVPGLNGDGDHLMLTTCQAGGHGTFVLCYEVPVEEGAKRLSVTAVAADVGGGVPDYDMEVYGPDDAHAGGSGNGGSDESFDAPTPAAGTWLVIVYYWAGGPGPVFGNVVTTIDVTY